jgi:hypothetical protein
VCCSPPFLTLCVPDRSYRLYDMIALSASFALLSRTLETSVLEKNHPLFTPMAQRCGAGSNLASASSFPLSEP